MHQSVLHLGCIVLGLSLYPSVGNQAFALPAGGVTPSKNDAIGAQIAPHRAVYKMSMLSSRNGSNVSDASGRMVFEWRDVCDGWAIQQHMQLRFSYSDGADQDLSSTELTWEAKDGKSYAFNIRQLTDGQETERYRGKAIENPDGSVGVSYEFPQGKSARLPAGTLFPTAHTKLILNQAMRGENFFSRAVFDGSDMDRSTDVSALILRSRPPVPPSKDKLKNNPLLAEPALPVHLAFFEPGTETGEPDYEMDIGLLPNGVVSQMKINYGDFSIVGSLDEIESLKKQNCP